MTVDPTIKLLMELTASFLTIWQMWKYGDKSLIGPIVGFVSNFAWWVLTIYTAQWGIMPVNAVMFYVNTRNYIKWKREAPSSSGG